MRSPSSFALAAAFAAFTPALFAQLDPQTGIVTGTNVVRELGAAVAALNGVKVINHGLVGVGRIDANSLDAWGESLGSVSGLQLTDWRRTGANRYAGTFHILPDRGYNSAPNFSNYAARIQRVEFTFAPEKGGDFRGRPAAQDQFTFSYDGKVRSGSPSRRPMERV